MKLKPPILLKIHKKSNGVEKQCILVYCSCMENNDNTNFFTDILNALSIFCNVSYESPDERAISGIITKINNLFEGTGTLEDFKEECERMEQSEECNQTIADTQLSDYIVSKLKAFSMDSDIAKALLYLRSKGCLVTTSVFDDAWSQFEDNDGHKHSVNLKNFDSYYLLRHKVQEMFKDQNFAIDEWSHRIHSWVRIVGTLKHRGIHFPQLMKTASLRKNIREAFLWRESEECPERYLNFLRIIHSDFMCFPEEERQYMLTEKNIIHKDFCEFFQNSFEEFESSINRPCPSR